MPLFLIDEYYVEIVYTLLIKRTAIRVTLNEEHKVFLNKDAQNYNTYFIKRIHNHNVVITFLPTSVDDTIAIAFIVTNIVRTFKELRFELIVDIRDDISNLNKDYDIRLEDVVVS